MKKLVSLGLLSLFFVMSTLSGSAPSGSQDHDLDQGILGQLVGAWRLAWLEEEGADGKFTGLTVPDCLSIRAMITCWSLE